MFKLRPYQEQAVADVRQAYASGYKAPLLVLPTGGGKTVIFAHIAANVASKGKRALVLVHRVELLRQTADKLRDSGAAIGLINPHYSPNLRAPIQVASVQTLVRRQHWNIPGFDLIVTDECHHVVSSTYRKILDQWPNAYNLGVTATPIRGDGLGLGRAVGGVYDLLLEGPQVSELIDLGYLVKPVIYTPKHRLDLSGVHTVAGDWNKKEVEARVDKPQITGDAVDHYRRICPGVPAVAFCVSVAHAHHVRDQFSAAGFRAAVADGSMDDLDRARTLGGLANGSVQVLCSCDLISEGTDIPAITAAILLRPTQSTGLYIQQVGRALRPNPGKPNAIILDHVGNVITHGLPDEPRAWTLDGDRKTKRAKGEQEARENVRQCPECYCVHNLAPQCPQCDFEYPLTGRDMPEQAEGELAVMTDAHRALLRRQANQQVARARTLEELQEIEKERGYKPGWAKHVHNARQVKRSS